MENIIKRAKLLFFSLNAPKKKLSQTKVFENIVMKFMAKSFVEQRKTLKRILFTIPHCKHKQRTKII